MPSSRSSLWLGNGEVAGSPAPRASSWTPNPSDGISGPSLHVHGEGSRTFRPLMPPRPTTGGRRGRSRDTPAIVSPVRDAGGCAMGWASCGAANPPTNRFCGECRTALVLACAACGERNPPTNRFCGECGARLGVDDQPRPGPRTEVVSAPATPPVPSSYTPRHLADRILSSRAALEGERKQVTVLFADLVGSTDLIRDLDPEDGRALLEPAVEAMLAAVHRFEGTVCRVMGDGIMALFGAPLAHEDHAARACYAALTMQEAIHQYGQAVREQQGVEVLARVGLNSGEVVVGSISNDLYVE